MIAFLFVNCRYRPEAFWFTFFSDFSLNWQVTLCCDVNYAEGKHAINMFVVKNTSLPVYACVCVLVGFWPYSSHVSNVLHKTPILFNMPQTCSHARRKNCTVFMDQIGKRVEQVWWNSYPYITLSTTKLFFGQCTTTVQSKSGQVDTKSDESTGIWRFQLQGSGQTQEIHWVSTGYPSVHWENLKDRHDMNVTWMIIWYDHIMTYYDPLLCSLTWVSQGCSMQDQVVEEYTV